MPHRTLQVERASLGDGTIVGWRLLVKPAPDVRPNLFIVYVDQARFPGIRPGSGFPIPEVRYTPCPLGEMECQFS